MIKFINTLCKLLSVNVYIYIYSCHVSKKRGDGRGSWHMRKKFSWRKRRHRKRNANLLFTLFKGRGGGRGSKRENNLKRGIGKTEVKNIFTYFPSFNWNWIHCPLTFIHNIYFYFKSHSFIFYNSSLLLFGVSYKKKNKNSFHSQFSYMEGSEIISERD